MVANGYRCRNFTAYPFRFAMICLHVPYKNRDIEFDIAQTWDELRPRQLAWVARRRDRWAQLFQMVKDLSEDADAETLLHLDNELQGLNIEVLTYLAGAKSSFLGLRARAWGSLYPDEAAWLFPDIQYLFKSNKRVVAPFPYLRIRGKKLIPAADSLSNISGAEFHFADRCFNDWKGGDPQALENLCAILYRPKGTESIHQANHVEFCGDARTTFNSRSIEFLAKRFRFVSRWKMEAIASWYEGCRTRIVENNPDVFSSSGKGEGSGFLDIFRALANDFSKIEQVGEKRLSLILYELNELDREHRRQLLNNLKK